MRSIITRSAWAMLLLASASLACNLPLGVRPTPTPLPPPEPCMEPVDLAAASAPDDPAAYADAIADFLTRGGSGQALAAMLRQWGVVNDDLGGVETGQDVNGDGWLDTVVTWHYPPTSPDFAPAGQLLVLACETTDGDPHYTTIYEHGSAPGSNTAMPALLTISDLTADGQVEIAFFVEHCTDTACYREPFILAWDRAAGDFRALHEQFAALYAQDEEDETARGFPFAGFEIVDRSGDGPLEFIVRTGAIPAREAGPQRPTTYVWSWNGTEYANPVVEPSAAYFRLHALQDADSLLISEDWQAAREAYGYVLSNRDLALWGGVEPSEANMRTEERMLDAYARYRLVLTNAAGGDLAAAEETLSTMQAQIPWQPGSFPSYYTYLAETFLEAFDTQANGDPLQAACEAVLEAARNPWMAPTYEFLGDQEYFGRSARPYSAEDLCPFASEAEAGPNAGGTAP